jgi:hypothetical protein
VWCTSSHWTSATARRGQTCAPACSPATPPRALWDRLAVQVEAAGFSVERGHCGGANGRTDLAARTVRVRDDVEALQAVKTLCHELAHVLLHDGTEYATACRGRAEIEAESVAFLVLTSAGVDPGAYTFPYVAAWSEGETARVVDTADRVVTCARSIVAGLGFDADKPAA